MACGLPLIITDMPNITDYVDDTCVIKVPLHGEDEIVEACQRIFESDFERDRLAAAARNQIMKFDWENIKVKFIKIIAI
jgi:glycosyltransferase involved in cell wall biosynthesis